MDDPTQKEPSKISKPFNMAVHGKVEDKQQLPEKKLWKPPTLDYTPPNCRRGNPVPQPVSKPQPTQEQKDLTHKSLEAFKAKQALKKEQAPEKKPRHR